MLTRTITSTVAIATLALSPFPPVEACRPIVLTVLKTDICDGWIQFKSLCEVQGKRFATNWKRDDKDEFKDCDHDSAYCYWTTLQRPLLRVRRIEQESRREPLPNMYHRLTLLPMPSIRAPTTSN
ncbi:hypothetical protein BG006_000887 [Podila minutissima]|uniref:Uncharacterized protein n=1 Tax=Podila minutissima TaxID=64525 RepID=A0A9P5SP71_9FUNG|nr:hypothetical protein BG006_000887 [Podila minutissima]